MWNIYRNTYGNRGIGNLGEREYGIWRGQFDGKSIGIHMGIGESVTWGGENTLVMVVNWVTLKGNL